ncbi:hypothetical protein SAMN06265365_14225 [Tistlia consotensis]|uniref:Uncharacterized protein n=1 Tax=Tistlia consotensis USBA 355 TaxID=560819 RepID=A0A1Y6CQ51_9PROT|nr:hypothetical protein [Tistlia consotensis]SMF82082.1 hypothetical protein SAMN05428998_14525 [Tistlia consotensis USBA 355]SNS25398.1 hypothetical protein SAMN06265365_14225 [Tistlia consotensis]
MADGVDVLATARFVTRRLETAGAAGITIRRRRSFAGLWGRDLPGKVWTPFFDPGRNDLLPDHLVVIEGCDSDGATVFLVAARRDELGTSPLPVLWQSWFDRFFPGGERLDRLSLPPGADRVRGTVAYFGEGWLHPALRSRKGLGAQLVELGMVVIRASWSDLGWLTGFVPRRLYLKGYAAHTGLAHTELFDDADRAAPGFLEPGEMFVYISAGEIDALVAADLRRHLWGAVR